MQTPDEEIKTLSTLNDHMNNQPSPLVQQSQIDDPTSAVENTLLSFMEGSFRSIKEDIDFENEMKDALRERAKEGKLNENQIISLLINKGTVTNDRISKLLGPFTQLSVARRNQETALAQSGAIPVSTLGETYKKLNQDTPTEIQQGLATLNMLLTRIVPQNGGQKIVPTEEQKLPVQFDIQPNEEIPIPSAE